MASGLSPDAAVWRDKKRYLWLAVPAMFFCAPLIMWAVVILLARLQWADSHITPCHQEGAASSDNDDE